MCGRLVKHNHKPTVRPTGLADNTANLPEYIRGAVRVVLFVCFAPVPQRRGDAAAGLLCTYQPPAPPPPPNQPPTTARRLDLLLCSLTRTAGEVV